MKRSGHPSRQGTLELRDLTTNASMHLSAIELERDRSPPVTGMRECWGEICRQKRKVCKR